MIVDFEKGKKGGRETTLRVKRPVKQSLLSVLKGTYTKNEGNNKNAESRDAKEGE